jgi:hypothetical protein
VIRIAAIVLPAIAIRSCCRDRDHIVAIRPKSIEIFKDRFFDLNGATEQLSGSPENPVAMPKAGYANSAGM